MSRVTSKLQVTVPKAIAEQYGIKPGDEIEWVPAGDCIRVVPPGRSQRRPDLETRLRRFEAENERVKRSQAGRRWGPPPRDRGWKREDLYVRGRPR